MRQILKELMEANQDDAYTLQDKCGVPQPTTQRFLSGVHKSANSATVAKWAAAYGVSESQLRGDVPINIEINDIAELKLVKENIIEVPLLNTQASMGDGATQAYEYVIDVLKINKNWADRMLKPYTGQNNLAFIHAIGDSMFPTFNDGDILMVDVGDKLVVDGKVYVLQTHGRLFIKRIRQRLDGIFEVSSDNPSVKTVDILNGEHEVEVKGRVLWAWNGRKV